VQEFEEAYEMKYDKKPKLVRRHTSEGAAEVCLVYVYVYMCA